jgi:hypothetical protein
MSQRQAGGTPTDTGFVIAGAGATVNIGSGPSWANPGNVTADDGTNATATVTFPAAQSDALKASNFGFDIPVGATIDGIEVRAQLVETGGTAVYNSVNIGKDDSTLATPKDPAAALDGTPTDYDQGGAADLWGLTWTRAEINSANFQVRVGVDLNASSSAGCDAIWVKVYYTI